MESGRYVTVQDNGDFIIFTPIGNQPVTGLVLYPGAHIDYRLYAPIARQIASRGYLVSIVKMPLSLPIFGENKADGIITAFPDIRYWVIGGHSWEDQWQLHMPINILTRCRDCFYGHRTLRRAITCQKQV